jgi:signal transduction histidine kinase/CheY-like chemotaxis protein
LGFGYVVAMLLLGLSWLVGTAAMSRVQASYRYTVVNRDGFVSKIYAIRKGMLDQETGSRAYFLVGERQFLAPYYSGRRALPAAFASASRLIASPADRRAVGLMFRRAKIWQRWVDSELKTWDSGDHAKVRMANAVGTGKRLFDSFRAANDVALRRVQRERQSALDSSASTFRAANIVLAAIVSIAIVLVLLLGWFLTRSIVRPLEELRSAATRIRAGHFDTAVPRSHGDEIGQLAVEMDAMREHLRVRRRLGDMLASTLDLEHIYPGLATEVRALVPFDRFSVTIVDEDETHVVTAYAEGGSDELQAGSRRPLDNSVFSRAMRSAEPLLIGDTSRIEVQGTALAAVGVRSLVMMPLRTKARIWGTLNVSSRTPDLYDEGTLATLATLTQPVANAVENASLYREIGDTNEALERANRMKSEFLANMSHELRTPLNAIIGFSEVLQDESFGPLNERQQRYVGNVLGAGNHLLELVNDILDISKVEAGRMELHREELDLRSLFPEVQATMMPLARNREVDLRCETAVEGLLVYADRARLTQILYNLTSNAIKFTPAGGTVSLDCHGETGRAVLSVTDTGIGIPEDDQARIFEEFEQIDSSVGRTQTGTGLGLALTKRLVELHGGTIEVQSAPGEGSSFTVTLPAIVAATPSDAIRGDILVVEDDPSSRELLRLYLAEAGYGLEFVERPDDVLPRARAMKPVAITLDLILQDQMSWTVLQHLKADPETHDIPVVIVSVLDEQQAGFALGANAHLTKPVTRHALLDTLAQVTSHDSGGETRALRVLAVDDEPDALELISLALEGTGHQLLKAASGAEALMVLAQQKPDVLIVDLTMEPVDGFEVIEAVMADPSLCDIPIIVATARDVTAEDMARLNGHAAAVFSKQGLQKNRLIQELKRLIPRTDRGEIPDAAG